MDGPLHDDQRPICYIIEPRGSTGSPLTEISLVAFEDASLGHVCHESREVVRRCGQFRKARDYNPSTDVLYVDNYYYLITMPHSSMLKIRHVAFPAHFYYDMLTEDVMCGQRSVPRGPALGKLLLNNDGDRFYTSLCLPGLESITVVLPPLEKSMPYYACHSPVAMCPSFLRNVPYPELQRIQIKGPYA